MHDKHRERVRKRMIREGLDAFELHQVIEYLLFHAIPRKDTNEMAHMLVKKFGSLSNILDADPKELMKVEGIGESAATFISFISQLVRRYYLDKLGNKIQIKNTSDAGEYAKALFIGRVYEGFFLICLNAQNRVIHTEMIAEGTIDGISVYPRIIVESALQSNAHSVILAHNHPGGSITPSQSDIDTTKIILDALKTIDIQLRDHIIVTNDDYFSFKDMRILK